MKKIKKLLIVAATVGVITSCITGCGSNLYKTGHRGYTKVYDAKHKGIISKHLEFIRFNEPVYKLDSTKSHKCSNYKSNCTANPIYISTC